MTVFGKTAFESNFALCFNIKSSLFRDDPVNLVGDSPSY